MMGHVADTYNDVHSLGIEKLRQECAASGLCIRPRQRISRLETIKEVLRAIGEDPDKPPHKRSSNRTGRIHDHTIRPRKPPHPDPATIPQPTTTNSPTSTYSKKHRHRKPPKQDSSSLRMVRPPGFEPGFPAISSTGWEAGVIDQAARQLSETS